MKDCNIDEFKRISELAWQTESFELKDENCGRKSIYAEGDVFHLDFTPDKSLGRITLVKPKRSEGIELPFFLNINPTWFIRDGVVFGTFIVGNDPCELHRFIIWFENLDSNAPVFHFEVIPLYDDCVCHYSDGRMMLMSGHGIGDGTGQNK